MGGWWNFDKNRIPTSSIPLVAEVTSGACAIDADECAMSPNYPANYGNNERCTIAIRDPSPPQINVLHFSTERGYDKLFVDGVGFHGSTGCYD